MTTVRKKVIVPFVLALAATVSFSTNADAQSKRTKNTMGGAAVGAGVGYLVGGSNGAAGGAVVGAIAGYNKKR